MSRLERCSVFKFVDEIDHYTIKCRDGKVSDIPLAVAMIHRYSAVDDTVAEAFSEYAVRPELLTDAAPEELYEILVRIRNVLLGEVWE